MGLEVFDHYECDGQIELFAIQEENMGTDKKTAERFYENYKACRDKEERKRREWYALAEMWKKDGYIDDALGDRVEAAQKEYAEAEKETNIFARLALDCILEGQKR